jgi:predicted RecA/RadA family phage recombinase
MAYTGQPVPTTLTTVYRAKVSDGKAVKVAVPESTTIEAGKFYVLDGFFGVAMQSLETAAGATGEIVLHIEQAEYETDNITTTENFAKGDLVYWNATTGKFTTTASTNRKVGRVTVKKDSNNVVWMLLGPQV